uniref:Uncharacterized protein n=1 Tax=Lepeophtheirus salmonis TaxID=72036 RepID=A0A0K2TEW5_LEPSM
MFSKIMCRSHIMQSSMRIPSFSSFRIVYRCHLGIGLFRPSFRMHMILAGKGSLFQLLIRCVSRVFLHLHCF